MLFLCPIYGYIFLISMNNNNIGIDTIRFIVSGKTFEKWINNNVNILPYTALKTPFIKDKNKLDTIIYPIGTIHNKEATNSFIFIRSTKETKKKSKNNNKNEKHYKEISINGLHQPHKKINEITYKVASKMLKRFNLSSIDLALDIQNNNSNSIILENVREYGKITYYKGTMYINSPLSNINLVKIKVYDKAKKENLNLNWLRIEILIHLNQKIQKLDYNFDNYIDMLFAMNKSFFKHNSPVKEDVISNQIKIFKDLRSISKKNNKYKEILNIESDTRLKKYPIKTAYIKPKETKHKALCLAKKQDIQNVAPLSVRNNLTIKYKIRDIISLIQKHNMNIEIRNKSLIHLKRKFKIVFND